MSDHLKTESEETIQSAHNEAMRDINERIRRVLDQAPSDATAELEMHQGPKGYKALLRIYSTQRKFVGGAQGAKFSEVVESLFKEVWQQIRDWKHDRHNAITALD